jgi:hypothetical protein
VEDFEKGVEDIAYSRPQPGQQTCGRNEFLEQPTDATVDTTPIVRKRADEKGAQPYRSELTLRLLGHVSRDVSQSGWRLRQWC